MKKILIAIALLGGSYAMQAQTVNGVKVRDIDAKHIEIVGRQKMMSTKVKVSLHFGQHDKVFSGKDTKVKDRSGKTVTFNSMIDALNFFAGNGYEFQQAYAVGS